MGASEIFLFAYDVPTLARERGCPLFFAANIPTYTHGRGIWQKTLCMDAFWEDTSYHLSHPFPYRSSSTSRYYQPALFASYNTKHDVKHFFHFHRTVFSEVCCY